MNYRSSINLFGILLLLIIAGCDLVNNEHQDEEIEAFVKTQDLPDAQSPVYILKVADQNFKAFRVSFGPPRDCPSGCFYSQAFGIKYGNRIGWTAVHIDSTQNSRLDFFEVRPGDDYLFSNDLRDRFQEVVDNSEDGSWNPHAYNTFLEMVAEDTDTPSAALLNIAEVLYSQYHPNVAVTLIENPVVRKNRLILETLAELPSFNRSESYNQVRDQANSLLGQLDE